MRLLMLGLNYAPEPVGIGPYTAGLAEVLAARGHSVTVVAGKPYYLQWRRYEGQQPGVTTSAEGGVTVIRVPHYIPSSPSGARRIAHHASFAVSALRPAMAAARGKPDLVFTIAPSMMSVPVAALAARKAGAPLWVHIQDFEVEAAFATGLLKPGSAAGRIARKAERRILQMADQISTISPQMCARLEAMQLAPPGSVYQLRNWSNAAFDFVAADPGIYRREWGIGNRKVALYSGNIANKQGIEILIEAARILRQRDDILFVICGEGPNRDRLAKLASGLGNVQLHGLQPAARMGDFLSLASVHLLPQITGAADLVLPSKLTNMLASGRPVIATAQPGTGLYEEVDGCGINTPPGDAAALAAAIAGLVDDKPQCQSFGEMAVHRAAERWSRGAIIDTLEVRLMQLAVKNGQLP